MDELSKKLTKLREALEKAMKQGGLGGSGSVKAGAVLPSINKLPKPGNNSNASKTGMPGIGQSSKKNPIKSAEQTQNKDIKDIKMKEAQAALKIKGPEMIKFEKNGQWSVVEKSNYKGYNAADNAKRKANNLSTDTGLSSMPRVKQYGGSGPSSASKEAAKAKQASAKNEVTMTHKHPETGENTTVTMSPRKMKNYQKKMKALVDAKKETKS